VSGTGKGLTPLDLFLLPTTAPSLKLPGYLWTYLESKENEISTNTGWPLKWTLTIFPDFSLTKNKFPDLFLPNVYTYAADNFTFYTMHNISAIVFIRKKEEYLPVLLKNNFTIIIVLAISSKVSITIIYTADFDSTSLLKHPIA